MTKQFNMHAQNQDGTLKANVLQKAQDLRLIIQSVNRNFSGKPFLECLGQPSVIKQFGRTPVAGTQMVVAVDVTGYGVDVAGVMSTGTVLCECDANGVLTGNVVTLD